MMKRKVVEKVGNIIMKIGGKAVGKSLILGLYEPQIREVLKKKNGGLHKNTFTKLLLCLLIISIFTAPFSISVNAKNKSDEEITDLIDVSNEKVGKTVTIFFKPNGESVVIEGNINEFIQLRATDELVSSYTLSENQTNQIKKNIQGITQAVNLINALVPFIPNPFAKVFLTVAKVAVFAEDLKWAGTYGHSVRLEEYCKLPHTSYSHYYRYTILD